MKSYWFKVLLFYCGVIPFVCSLVIVGLMGLEIYVVLLTVVVMIVSGIIAGLLAGKEKQLPESFGKRYAPIVFPLGFTLFFWTIFMLISGGFYGSGVWGIYGLLQLPFGMISLFSSLYGIGPLFFYAPLSFHSAFLISFFTSERSRSMRSKVNKRQLLSSVIILFIIFGIGQTVQVMRNQTVLPSYGFDYEGGYSSTDLWPYHSENPDHQLPRLTEPATFTIDNQHEMPVLDGAEAAFPVYSAFAFATYDETMLNQSEKEYVSFTNTIYAYERLLDQEVDIYFGAEPSKEQRLMAEDRGLEIVMTPIGKEAFVFFVNETNSVSSLEVTEIQDIYSGKINNWREVGGINEKIIAFQRPKNSGSQTLLEKIMGDTPLIKPLKEDVPQGMGGIIEQVADYRNYENSLGFSFRFFATGMNHSEEIKLLAINGIDPNAENISLGTYPFTAELYAITLKDNPKSTVQPFIEWMQGPQGQEIVEEIGYVKLLNL